MAFHPYPQLIQTFFNTNWFGPPPHVTAGSTWPWIDHLASGLLQRTRRAIHTRFRFGSDLILTSLVRSKSQAHYAKGMPSLSLRHFVDTRFQILFTPLPGYFFTFPSRYYALSVIDLYLGLESGLPGFSQRFTCADLLGILLGFKSISLTGVSPSMPYLSR